MTRKYTPGPWVADALQNGSDHINVWEQCGIGHIAAVSTGLTPDPFGGANARLIAAAPDLLELLIELTDIEGPLPGTAEWANKVKAAIAKATGEGAP